MVLNQDITISEKYSVRSVIKSLFKKRKKQSTIIILLSIVVSFFEMLSISLLVPALEQILNQSTDINIKLISYIQKAYSLINVEYTVLSLFIGIALIYIFKALINIFLASLINKEKLWYEISRRKKICDIILYSDWIFINGSMKSYITNILTNEIEKDRDVYLRTLNLLPLIFLLFVYVLLLFLLSFEITLMIFLIIGGVTLILGRLVKNARYSGSTILSQRNLFMKETLASLDGLKNIKSMSKESFVRKLLYEKTEYLSKIRYEMNDKMNYVTYLHEPANFIPILMIIYITMTYFYVPISVIGIMIYVFLKLSGDLKSIQTEYYRIKFEIPSMNAVDVLINEGYQNIEKDGDTIINNFNDKIEFKNVSFSYSDKSVLKNINLTINKGEKIAIFGQTGVGKSTLIDLLLGLIYPKSGKLTIDGIQIQKIKKESWHKILTWMGQDPYLFYGTIEENITWGQKDIHKDKLNNACKMACCNDFVNNKGISYEYIIGDRGSKLSGGQKQRIALARVFLEDPEIVILDEPSSHLDLGTKNLLLDNIEKFCKNKTLIMITHDHEIPSFIDTVYVFDKGEIKKIDNSNKL
ncbi:MAG: putative ABC transporter ATP-binding protein [Candidatus Methanofastidiosum methylothiophilum]|uniref:Putative ABC transporter ATP-binding protein n=1 Tax=Candidatus Methanofastidiosum methylothiophilum TaxID=1705564 RepID=A0A150J805_9EURY|nr:MAG: putative ABC transporter ATP-binding protein [Candidatus Methanofastidiosum methylthiophilus]